MATAASADQLRLGGKSLNAQTFEPGRVVIEVRSTTRARKIHFLVGSRKIGTDSTLVKRAGRWVGSMVVDLSSAKGRTEVGARVYAQSGRARTLRGYVNVASVPQPAGSSAAVSAPTGAPVVPSSGGRPGPANTGVPSGLALRPSGSINVSTPGAVLDGLDIKGCVLIRANNVTIRNSRVTCLGDSGTRAVRTERGVSGFVLEDSEIKGTGTIAVGVEVSHATLRRLNVHSVDDGIRVGHGVQLLDSWVHDLARRPGGHPDAVQGISAKDIMIRNNTLDPRNRATGDLGNSAIMLGSETAPYLSSNVVIQYNYLDGGNFTINIRGDINAEGFLILGNIFGTGSRYGPILTPSSVLVGTGNVTEGSGAAVKVAQAK